MRIVIQFFASLPFIVLASCDCGDRLIETYPLGDNGQLKLYAEKCWEYSQGLYYVVELDDNVLESRTWFTSVESEPTSGDFVVLKNSDMTIFALVRKTNKSRVFILFDSVAQTSWPRRGKAEMPDQARERARVMLEKLTQEPEISRLQIVE